MRLDALHLHLAVCLLALPSAAAGIEPASALKRSFLEDLQPVLHKNCITCHNPAKSKKNLDLTSVEMLLRGSASGSIVRAGEPGSSLLYKVVQPGSDPHMPPDRQLEPGEIQAIARWIGGLPAETERIRADILRKAGSQHWSFRKLRRPPVPEAAGGDGAPRNAGDPPANPIDAFLIRKFAELAPEPRPGPPIGFSPEAAPVDLIRRLYFDLAGLPPSPEEAAEYTDRPSPEVFARIADRLLASPRFGERWARRWLDLARFAESNGFKADEPRPQMFRYRDYVIRSLNADKPYNLFIEEQIAGDELAPDDPEARIATAFNRHYADESNARDLLQRRQEILNDITDTVGSVFLGLTVGCARCHDHKYDPITQADYYRLQSFFANVRATDSIPMVSGAEVERHRRLKSAWEEKTAGIRKGIEDLLEPRKASAMEDFVAKFPAEIQVALRKNAGERSPIEQLMFFKAEPYLRPDDEAAGNGLKPEQKKRWQELKAQLDGFKGLDPGSLPAGSGIIDAGREAPKTHILAVGAHTRPQEEVGPGFIAALDPATPYISPPAGIASTGRRAALAAWLAGGDNPLTARVLVNRLWQGLFGQGIVASPSDFGRLGDAPTHPELLDWLAAELIENGWSVKLLLRLMLHSKAYRQSTLYRPEAARLDPENRLLWRFPRQRLEAEVIRDAALQVSGLLSLRMFGPGVFPELPAGADGYGWNVSAANEERNRRSVYIFVKRNSRYPMFTAFDMPDTHETCARRLVTTTPTQALMLLNGKQSLEWAERFAERVLAAAGDDIEAQTAAAYQLAFNRAPDAAELETAEIFLGEQAAQIAARSAREAGKTSAPPPAAASKDPAARKAALADLCHVLFNANEFVYRN